MKSPKTLIIIDIDDTFLPHRTVSIGHRLFWKRFPDIKLFLLGAELYMIKLYREILNMIGIRISNEYLIRKWIGGIIRSDVTKKEYELPCSNLRKLIYSDIFDLYRRLLSIHPDRHVIAITKSFMVYNSCNKPDFDMPNNPLFKILWIDEFYSNKFFTDKKDTKIEIIRSAEIIIKNGKDKLRIAQDAVNRITPKKVILFIDDYEDLELLRLREIKGLEVVTAFAGKKIRKYVGAGCWNSTA